MEGRGPVCYPVLAQTKGTVFTVILTPKCFWLPDKLSKLDTVHSFFQSYFTKYYSASVMAWVSFSGGTHMKWEGGNFKHILNFLQSA